MAFACGCDPTASCTGWCRNSDQEQRTFARGRDAGDLAGEVSVTIIAEPNRGGIEDRRCRRARIGQLVEERIIPLDSQLIAMADAVEKQTSDESMSQPVGDDDSGDGP
jgi:hypothetical protein